MKSFSLKLLCSKCSGVNLFDLGYTFHHGSGLRVTASGAVMLENVVTSSGIRKLNLRTECKDSLSPGPREMFRDVLGK